VEALRRRRRGRARSVAPDARRRRLARGARALPGGEARAQGADARPGLKRIRTLGALAALAFVPATQGARFQPRRAARCSRARTRGTFASTAGPSRLTRRASSPRSAPARRLRVRRYDGARIGIPYTVV